MSGRELSLTVNGSTHQVRVPDRTSLADLLREELLLTGTHLGCEHGACGACTVLVDGRPVRSCTTLAASCRDRDVVTIEGLDHHDPEAVHALRDAFSTEHGLQCGFCTPGMLVTAVDVVRRRPDIEADDLRVELSGNLCRCTGYVGIVRSIMRASRSLAEPVPAGRS
jgi:carbon-monoxide dehydrogenase small subunit